MKILFLHLSDLHLDGIDGVTSEKIQAATDSLSIFSAFEGVVIIISGDIAASGKQNQYKSAATLIGRLTSNIKSKYSISDKNFKLLLVPGNHDINYGAAPRLSPETVRAFTLEDKMHELNLELIRMDNCFRFLDNNGCFFSKNVNGLNSRLITRKILHFENGYRIEANLINTAPFSCSNDDGLHILPDGAIQQLNTPSHADISVVVMHHSPDWFEFSQRKSLQKSIAKRCSLAFYGHEHFPNAQHIFHDNGEQIINQDGGAWWQRSAPMLSEYYAALFDTTSRDYSLSKFRWNLDRFVFDNVQTKTTVLMPKPLNGSGLICQEAYMTALLSDTKYAISKSIADYFVFPGLRLNSAKDYSSTKAIRQMGDLVSFVKNNRYVAIIGGSNSGKTTLLKMLFVALQSSFAVLYCGTDDITGRSQQNILKELVQNTYGDNSYSAFQQTDMHNRAIIIDDMHRIAPKHLSKFLNNLEAVFGTIIIASVETSQFDVIQIAKDNFKSNQDFKKAKIAHLYAEKRLELIDKVARLKMDADDAKTRSTVRSLEQYLNSYKLSFRTEIDFVVQYTDYYCTHIGELEKSDATVFSKVFEASIERAITPHLIGKKENPNDIVVALSEVAHYIHFNREYPISAEHLSQVISFYCEYYDNRYLTPDRFLEIAESSNLLKKAVSGYEYRFASKNHLAYFVAKAINRKFHDSGDIDDLAIVVEHSCFSINGDILMFLTYITDNVRIPRLLLTQAVSYVKDWNEFDFSAKKIRFLQAMPLEQIEAPAESQREQEVKEQALEEENQDLEIIETLDIYDYDITKIGELNNQLIRALLQLQIISRNFSAFISILPAQDKQEHVSAIYSLPNKIFSQWAESVDNNIESLIDDILEWQNDKDYQGKKLSRPEVKRFFQEISYNMLLNLYFIATRYGANNNTSDYLSGQDYIENSINYKIERMMFHEKVDDVQLVIKEAEDLYETHDDGMIRNMVLSVLRHMLIFSDTISNRERRRISSTYFSPKAQTGILVSRQKALKEKGV